jgi:type IV pilus assembly protein PilQ
VWTPVLLVAALSLPLASPAAPAGDEREGRISIDVKDAEIADVVRLLAEIGAFQVVMDPGLTCKLTLNLKEVRWETAFDVALRSCGLGHAGYDGILRVAPVAKLTAEAAEERRLAQERELKRPLRTVQFRLSHARAQELAPLVKRFLSLRGEVMYDARTNTLIVTDIAP